MAVTNENNRNQYTSTGGTGYDFDFLIYDEEDILVTVTDAADGSETTLALTTGYTVSGVGEAAGGRVSTVAAVDAGDLVTITRDQALTQPNTLKNTGELDMETITQMFDEACMRDQMLKEALDRCVRVTVGSSASAGQWLDLAQGYMSSAQTAAAAAAASEAAAAGYETGAESAATAAENYADEAQSAANAVSGLTGDIAAVSAVAEAASALANSNSGRMYWAGVRQTVEMGATDSDGYADWVSGTGTASALILCSAETLRMTFAGGFDARGPLDYVIEETADQTVAMTPGAINYIYADYNAGSPTYGKTPYQPQYLEAEPSNGLAFGAILADFEGTDGDTSFTGAYGESWTFGGDAHIEQDQQKFGSTSVQFDGTGDFISLPADFRMAHLTQNGKWTIEGFVRIGSLASLFTLFSTYNASALPVAVNCNTSGNFLLYLSSNGSTFDLANGSASGNTFTTNTWYHFALVFDGSKYVFYVNGSAEITVATSTEISTAVSDDRLMFGAQGVGASNPFTGYMDAIRITPYARWTTGFTAPAAQPTVEDLYYFNIPEMKMYVGQPGSFVADTILFLGEADVGADGDIDSVVSYAIRGRYDSDWFSFAADTNYSKSHNLGISPSSPVTALLKCVTADGNYVLGDVVDFGSSVSDSGSADRGIIFRTTRSTIRATVGSSVSLLDPTTLNTLVLTINKWNLRVLCDRGW